MPSFEIMAMTLADYAEATALWREAEGICLGESDTREAIGRYLRRNPGLSLIARDSEGRLIGALLCGHDGRRGLLHHLAVAPAWRRCGIGRNLVQAALAGLRTAGLKRCVIFILNANQEGTRFWHAGGWEPGDHEQFSVMFKNLNGDQDG